MIVICSWHLPVGSRVGVRSVASATAALAVAITTAVASLIVAASSLVELRHLIVVLLLRLLYFKLISIITIVQ